MAQRLLRPLDNAALLDELFDLCKSNFLLYFGMSAVLMVPVYTLVYALGAGTFGNLDTLIAAPFQFIVTAAGARAVSETYLGRKPTILASFAAIRGRFWAMFWTLAVTQILIGLGSIACLIPGILFSVWYFFVAPVFMLEGKAWGDARIRSKDLGEGHGMRIFVVYFLTSLLTGVITMAAYGAAYGVSSLTGIKDTTLEFGIGAGLLMGLGISLSTPIQVIVSVLLYYDLRVRKEGFDIEMLAEGMGERTSNIERPTSNFEQGDEGR